MKAEKCKFNTSSLTFLDFVLESEQVKSDPEKIQAVLDSPIPSFHKQLQQFLGFANFYRRFMRNYSGIALPLTSLTSIKKPFVWSSEADKAFNELKKRFAIAPILTQSNPSRQFILEVNASDTGVGAVLSQNPLHHPDNKLHLIAF